MMLTKDILMKSRFLLLFILLFTACAPQVTAATSIPTSVPTLTSVPDEPIQLFLAIADAKGNDSEPYALEFVDQVKDLSNENITVIPFWNANASFERGVINAVKEGNQYQLGIAGSRAWDVSGATSFQALQAPFLITNDALAEAVASSEIGTRLLGDLSSVGITGLGLWPEDLEHPISIIPDKRILSPEDLKGLAVRTRPSEVSYMLIDTLGGTPMFSDSNYQAYQAGMLQWASMASRQTATGNVTFFPKFQVLFVNEAAFEKLSEGQRSILREAAAATQKKAIAEHPKEVDIAATWCANDGSIVMASDEQIAAFESAVQPVFDWIEQDPFNAELIAAIRELKIKTTPSPGAMACSPG